MRKILPHTLHWNNEIIPALGINPGFPSPEKAKFWGLTFHWNQIFQRILWSTLKEYLDFGAHFIESIGSFSHLPLGTLCDNPRKSHRICSAKEGNNASANRFSGIEAGSGSYFPFPQRVWLQRALGWEHGERDMSWRCSLPSPPAILGAESSEILFSYGVLGWFLTVPPIFSFSTSRVKQQTSGKLLEFR